MERREIWQFQAVVEDQRGFDAAIGQEKSTIELWKVIAILGHMTCAFVPLVWATRYSFTSLTCTVGCVFV